MKEQSMDFGADSISAEEEVESMVEVETESVLSKAGRALLYGFLFLFPLWFLPTALGPVELNKAYFGIVALVLSCMLVMGGALQEGRLRFISSRVYLVYSVFAIVWLLGALFSSSPLASLWGIGIEPRTFLTILISGIALAGCTFAMREQKHLYRAIAAFFASIGISVIYFFLHSVFHVQLLSWSFAESRGFHPLGDWETVSAFLGLGVVMTLPFVSVRSIRWRVFTIVLAILCFAGLIFANVSQIWIALAIIALVFTALFLSQREQRSGVFAATLFLLLVSILFALLSGPLDRKFTASSDRFGRPQEAVLTQGATLGIARGALAASPVFGYGPATFGIAWDRFKDSAVNATVFWQTRFASGNSEFLTIVAETGVAGSALFLLLFFVLVGSGVRALGKTSGPQSSLVRSLFAGALFLFLLWFLVPQSQLLVVMTFVLTGLFVASLADARIVRAYDIPIFATRERGFIFSLLIIFFLAAGVGGLYLTTTRYLAALAFGRGIEIYNTEGAVNGAENEIVGSALALDSTQGRYYEAYAQLEYVKIQRAFNDASLDQKTRQERFQDAYGKAVGAARTAVDLTKNDAQAYRLLGQIYESAIPIDTNVADLALENYDKAHTFSPVDPSILVDSARVHLAIADVTLIRGGGSSSQKIAADERAKAVDLLKQAVSLKPDYTEAHFTLAQLYGVAGKLDEAIASAEATTKLAPDNVGALFQLGLLYYKKSSLDAAKAQFERAIKINSNYSNAKYFLGLIYDQQGKRDEALELFREIESANPDNEEVKNIIASLENGKSAQDALSTPPPEERKGAPISDGGSKIDPTP